jgi:hypothetical protein
MRLDLLREERVSVIVEITGFSRDEVLGRLFRLWAWCAQRGLQDAPEDCDRYVVSDGVIERFFGARGVAAFLADGVPELGMGKRRSDGSMELHGTSETVARFRAVHRMPHARGGVVRRDTASRSPNNGRFVSDLTNAQRRSSGDPAEVQRSASGDPAEVQLRSQIPDPIPEIPYPSDTDPNAVRLGTLPKSSDVDSEHQMSLLVHPPSRKPRQRKAKSGFEVTESERQTAIRVLGKLSERNGVQYQGTDAHLRLIVRQLRDGRSELDLRKVIAFCAEPIERGGKGWEDDPKMRQYLTPETLFGPESIQRYVDAALSWAARAYPQQEEQKR